MPRIVTISVASIIYLMNYYIKNTRTQKSLTVTTDQRSTKSEDYNSCMICTKGFK